MREAPPQAPRSCEGGFDRDSMSRRARSRERMRTRCRSGARDRSAWSDAGDRRSPRVDRATAKRRARVRVARVPRVVAGRLARMKRAVLLSLVVACGSSTKEPPPVAPPPPASAATKTSWALPAGWKREEIAFTVGAVEAAAEAARSTSRSGAKQIRRPARGSLPRPSRTRARAPRCR